MIFALLHSLSYSVSGLAFSPQGDELLVSLQVYLPPASLKESKR